MLTSVGEVDDQPDDEPDQKPHPGLPLQLQDEEQRRKDSQRRHDGRQREPEGPGGIWARVAEEDETGTLSRAATLRETSSSRIAAVSALCSIVHAWCRFSVARSRAGPVGLGEVLELEVTQPGLGQLQAVPVAALGTRAEVTAIVQPLIDGASESSRAAGTARASVARRDHRAATKPAVEVQAGSGLLDRVVGIGARAEHPVSNRNSANVTQRHLQCLQDDRFLTDRSQLPTAPSK